MRRAAALFAAILIIIMYMSPAAYAATAATSGDFAATVYADGRCQVTVRLTLHLDNPDQKLTYPIPGNAYGIQVNGAGAAAHRSGAVLLVDLSRVVGNLAGDISVTISYSIPNIIEETEDGLVLELPLLCGFAYPVENLRFAITLPGNIPGRPGFTSTYYQTRIEESITYETLGNQLSGGITRELMGSDWLTMDLIVSEEMFPQEKPIVWTMGVPELAMTICAILAFLYWMLFLRALPPRFVRRTTAPDGIPAGEIASALVMGRPDLTMMVVQWAQLGYLLIHLDDNGRVLLHKRMDMGNERSQYENRIFRSLFGSKKLVDGTGYHYAQLCRKVSAGKSGVHGLYRSESGSPYLFRALAALIGLFGGYSLGTTLAGDSFLRGFVGIVMALVGLVSAWFIQEGCQQIHLRQKLGLWLSLGLCAGWIALGAAANAISMAGWVVAGELLAGLAAAYGGRRTENGRHAFSQILGLRRQLRRMDSEALQQILRANPDYFHTMAPYALALGVDQAFARQFGAKRLSPCPYLTGGMDGHMTAAEWCRLLRDAASILDERQRQLFWERLLGR